MIRKKFIRKNAENIQTLSEAASIDDSRLCALTLKPAWAWLVCAGYKDIENRSWNTLKRGKILIHASKNMTASEYGQVHAFAFSISETIARALPDYPTLMRDFSGRIIGQAVLADVYEPFPKKPTSPWHFEDHFGFKLESACLFEHRLPYKGALGFFYLDAISEKIMKEKIFK